MGASNKGGVGKTSHFLALNVNISKMAGDTCTSKSPKLLLMTNRKSHYVLSIDIKIDNLG